MNQIQERLLFLHDILINPLEMKGWVNGNFYLATVERLGILPVPDDVRQSCGMAEFIPTSSNQKQPHLYLARMQGTRKAILPVHTPAERELFSKLMATNKAFNSHSAGPTWKLAVKVWNEQADAKPEICIYYKVYTNYHEFRDLISLTAC